MSPQSRLDTLKHDLLEARKNRDQLTTETLQAVLARITNAEAVPLVEQSYNRGVGSTEAARKELSDADIQALIQQELNELTAARTSMAAHPDHPYVDSLDKKIAIVSHYTA